MSTEFLELYDENDLLYDSFPLDAEISAALDRLQEKTGRTREELIFMALEDGIKIKEANLTESGT